jgi:hypothetical protein
VSFCGINPSNGLILRSVALLLDLVCAASLSLKRALGVVTAT